MQIAHGIIALRVVFTPEQSFIWNLQVEGTCYRRLLRLKPSRIMVRPCCFSRIHFCNGFIRVLLNLAEFMDVQVGVICSSRLHRLHRTFRTKPTR